MKFRSPAHESAHKQILDAVSDYYKNYMAAPPYKEGDYIRYAGRVFDETEVRNLVDSALEFWLTAGCWTEQFEQDLAAYLGLPHCLLVNSGSSANLLAFMALTSPLLEERAVRRGDEVITVAAGFPTTVAPIVQAGAAPVFVDITIPQYNIDAAQLETALSPKTKAVFLAHTLGNPFDLRAVTSFCKRHNLWLIEDNCDALGARYTLDGGAKPTERPTGSFGDIGTSSFYPAHHITTGEGGAVYTANPLLHKIMRSLRDWGRDCICPAGRDNFCGHRFDKQYGELPAGYDHKYVYSHFGYNLKATDMQAALGCAQLKKLPAFVEARRRNWQYLSNGLQDVQDKLILPEACPASRPSWFGFVLTCRPEVDCNALVSFIEQRRIQSRRLFAGNIVRHPCFDGMRKTGAGYRIAGSLANTDLVTQRTFWLGVYPGMNDAMLDRMIEAVKAGVRQHD